MRNNIWKYLLLLCVLALGAAIIIWVYHQKLENQRAEMQKRIEHSDRRTKQMQRRYAEQKALADRYKRGQSSLEGQKSEISKELEESRKAVVLLEKEKGELESELKTHTDKLEACGKERRILAGKLSELENKFVQNKSDFEKKISIKEGENSELRSKLGEVEHNLESCSEKNARLCVIAEKVLDKYENKSAFSSILQKEPLLQFEKVELENYVEEYRDRIEKNRQKKEEVKPN